MARHAIYDFLDNLTLTSLPLVRRIGIELGYERIIYNLRIRIDKPLQVVKGYIWCGNNVYRISNKYFPFVTG